MEKSLKRKQKTKYIFILGGVISGLGKGVCAASISVLLQGCGLKVFNKKVDPYLNPDPGTMNPIEHGECYVTGDGKEADLDLGYYERFTQQKCTKDSSSSQGQLMLKLLEAERKGFYMGKTVQLVPHFTLMIQSYFERHPSDCDVCICEVGGSSGDIESAPFYEAIRGMQKELGPENVMICLVTYIVLYKSQHDFKTKPTQVAIRQLMQSGLQPDFIFARSEEPFDQSVSVKIAGNCNVPVQCVIQAFNLNSIYEVPLDYHRQNLEQLISQRLHLKQKKLKIQHFVDLVQKINQKREIVIKVGMIGKYMKLEDSYASVIEAINASGWQINDVKTQIINIDCLDSDQKIDQQLKKIDCAVITGGFGKGGIQGYLHAIQRLRESTIPTIGICYGLQLTCIEFAQNVLGIKNATSREIVDSSDKGKYEFIVDFMSEWKQGDVTIKGSKDVIGGTLRLGDYQTDILPKTLAKKVYNSSKIIRRHRHRYEVNIKYQKQFEKHGLIFSGLDHETGKLPEIVENTNHPFYITCQYHPEFSSTPFRPEEMFYSLIKFTAENLKI